MAVTGNHTLHIEPMAGSDSVRLVLNGTGQGPTFSNTALTTARPDPPIQAGGTADSRTSYFWLHDRYDRYMQPYDDAHIVVKRLAYRDRTVFQIAIPLSRVTNPRAADAGSYVVHAFRRYDEQTRVAYFIFSQVSTGLIAF